MTKEYLATLTREELIDLILQLQTAVIELKARMAELEAQLASKTSSAQDILQFFRSAFFREKG